MVSGSVAGSSRPKKKKASKKPKAGGGDEGSVVDGKAGGVAGGKKRRASNASLEDDEGDGGGSHTMAVDVTSSTKEEKARELEHRALLVRSLDPEQFRRYEAWRACRWPDAVIRRVCSSFPFLFPLSICISISFFRAIRLTI